MTRSKIRKKKRGGQKSRKVEERNQHERGKRCETNKDGG